MHFANEASRCESERQSIQHGYKIYLWYILQGQDERYGQTKTVWCQSQMDKLSRYVVRDNRIYRFSRKNLLGEYIKVLLVTFVSIVYSNAAQA